MRLVLKHVPGNARPTDRDAPWFLLVDLASPSGADGLAERLGDVVAPLLEHGRIADGTITASETQRAALWRLRHSVTEANKKEGMGFSHDIAVPVFAVADFVESTGSAVAAAFPQAEIVVVGHLGDGNLHYNVMFPHDAWAREPDQAATKRAVNHLVYDAAAAFQGTFSAEHGVGALHLPEMERYKDPVELDLMRGLKRHLDPGNIMNPGRVLPA